MRKIIKGISVFLLITLIINVILVIIVGTDKGCYECGDIHQVWCFFIGWGLIIGLIIIVFLVIGPALSLLCN